MLLDRFVIKTCPSILFISLKLKHTHTHWDPVWALGVKCTGGKGTGFSQMPRSTRGRGWHRSCLIFYSNGRGLILGKSWSIVPPESLFIMFCISLGSSRAAWAIDLGAANAHCESEHLWRPRIWLSERRLRDTDVMLAIVIFLHYDCTQEVYRWQIKVLPFPDENTSLIHCGQ